MHNQTQFEVIRDLISKLENLPAGQSIAISVSRHEEESTLFDWETSRGECYNRSEIANALKEAYHIAINTPRGGTYTPPKETENE